jgi:Holliday junction resolvasome RuvABC endonuclease subunit
MNIMGLDLSLTSTGVSINGETSIVSSKAKGAQRLSEITKIILELCINNNIKVVIIEGYSFASRNSQAHSIGELGGCVRMAFWENNIFCVEVPPTCRAKFATGRGNASKGEVISAISAKTGKIFSGAGGNDECDAWVLEEMARAKLGTSKWDWSKEQLSALIKVEWGLLFI